MQKKETSTPSPELAPTGWLKGSLQLLGWMTLVFGINYATNKHLRDLLAGKETFPKNPPAQKADDAKVEKR